MAQGFLNISHNFAGESQFIICEWVKSTAQGTPVIGHVTGTGLGAQNDTDVTEVFYPAAHVNEQLQVINLPEVWHLVRFWRSSDGTAKDVLLLQLAGNARTGALYPVTKYEYVVDRGESEAGIWADPVQDDTGLDDTRLMGQTYWIEERGTGTLLAAEIADRPTGGFDFTASGKVMESGSVYFATVIQRIDTEGDEGSGIDSDEEVYQLTANEDYSPLIHNKKTLLANFSIVVGTLTIPNLLLVADSEFILQTHSGLQHNVVIQLDPGDVVNFRKASVNKIVLGDGESIRIIFRANVMYVTSHETNHFRLGQRIWGDFQMLNTLLADGTEYNQADYPRVIELLDVLPGVIDYTTWDTSVVIDGITRYPNKGKFARNNGTGKFRVPDMSGQSIKSLAGAEVAGRYENQDIIAHDHYISSGGDAAGPYLSSNHGSGGNSSYQFNQGNTVPVGFKTSSVGNAENLVNNIGLYPLICI